MTARSLGLALLIGAFAIGGEVADWKLLRQIGAALAVVGVASYLWSRLNISRLSLTREMTPGSLPVGGILNDHIEVRSRALLPKLWVELRDRCTVPAHDASRLLSLRSRGRQSWSAQSVAVKRGNYTIGPVLLRSSDLLDVFSHERRFDFAEDVLVYPPVFELKNLLLPGAHASGGPHVDRRTPFLTPAVAGVRDYYAGDPFNRISWTATAKTGRLMVKEFDLDPTAEIWIVADFSARQLVRATRISDLERRPGQSFAEAWLDSTEEFVAALAASVARMALDQSRSVGLINTSIGREVFQAERSERQYFRMLTSLALSTSNGTEALTDVLNREMKRFDRFRSPILITASQEQEWIESLRSATLRGVKPTVIYIDPSSFDVSVNSTPVIAKLRLLPFPVHIVDFRQGIVEAFSAFGPRSLGGSSLHANDFETLRK